MRKIVMAAILLLACGGANAQSFEYGLDFRVRFDNREYKSEFSNDKTLFGLKLAPEVGVRWAANNVLMAGVDYTRHFGADSKNQPDPELMLYYGHDNHMNFSAHAGIFQRSKTTVMHRALFSGAQNFYDPLIEGMALRYYGRRGYVEAVCDWHGMLSESRREKFVIQSVGILNLIDRSRIALDAGYQLQMHHFSVSKIYDNVVDNVFAYPFVKAVFSLDKPRRAYGTYSYTNSYVSVGWLQSWQNDREGDEGYVKPNGLLIDAHLQWRSVGINNSFFFGDNMMPYYDRYGSELYLADPFYRTTNDVYNRLEVFWAPRIGNHMTLKVSSVHHYDGDCWNWQQVVAFSVAFGK